MKRLFVTILLFLGFLATGFSQKEGGKKDGGRLQALEIAYITKRLNLSTAEAQKFWPIYNQYKQELRSARTEQLQRKLSIIEVEEKVLNIRKKYNDEFVKALSTEKVNTFFRAENDFRNVVQQEMMERRQERLEQNRNRIKQLP
jgi:hypothetical protein